MSGVRPARRRENLVLLIVFIALFVITLVWAIVETNTAGGLQTELARAQQELRAIGTGEGSDFESARNLARNENKTLTQALLDEKLATATLIEPAAADADSATLTELVNRAKGRAAATAGLTPAEAQQMRASSLPRALDLLADRVAATQQRMAELQNEIRSKDEQIAQGNRVREELIKAHADALAERDARLQAVENEKGRFEEEQRALVSDVQASADTQREQLELQNQQLQTQVAQGQFDLNRQRQRSQALQSKIRDLRPQQDPLRLALQSDGQVLQVTDNGGRVYINVGREDRVPLGLTFEVYSAETGFTPTGLGKASIEVIALQDRSAEARVVRTTPGDPIITGDFVSNVIFDRARTYRFAVAGAFDVDSDGVRRDVEADKVREWIRAWGGEISQVNEDGQSQPQVTEQTDFLVVGQPPARPAPIDEATADVATREQFRRAEEAYNNYQTLRGTAVDLGVPILSENQFLNFIGKPVIDATRRTTRRQNTLENSGQRNDEDRGS